MKSAIKFVSGVVGGFLLMCSAARATPNEYQAMLLIYMVDSDVSGQCSYVYPQCWFERYMYWQGYYVGAANFYASKPCTDFTGGCQGRTDAVDTMNMVAMHAWQQAAYWYS